VLDDGVWSPRAVVDANLLQRQSPLIVADGDYEVDKRYMRFGRRGSDDHNADAAAADKRYMRFGRAHFHPLMGFTKRYMRFGRR